MFLRWIQLLFQCTARAKVVALIPLLFLMASCESLSPVDYRDSRFTADGFQADKPAADVEMVDVKGILVASVTFDISSLGKRPHKALFFIRNLLTGKEFRMSSNVETPVKVASSMRPDSKSTLSVFNNVFNSVFNAQFDNRQTPSALMAPFLSADESVSASIESASIIMGSRRVRTQYQRGLVHAYELDPGTYEISKWQFYSTEGIDYVELNTEDRQLFAFEVKQGEVAYLCNCHISVDIGNDITGMAVEDGADASLRDKSRRDMRYARKEYPGIAGLKVNNVAAEILSNSASMVSIDAPF